MSASTKSARRQLMGIAVSDELRKALGWTAGMTKDLLDFPKRPTYKQFIDRYRNMLFSLCRSSHYIARVVMSLPYEEHSLSRESVQILTGAVVDHDLAHIIGWTSWHTVNAGKKYAGRTYERFLAALTSELNGMSYTETSKTMVQDSINKFINPLWQGR